MSGPREATPIRLACLDMAGTTVADDGLVLAAFSAALDALRVTGPIERERMTRYVVDTMGESKITVFRALFPGDEQAAQEGNAAFEAAYGARVELVRALPGAEETFAALRSEGMAVALTTGFSRTTADTLLERLGWNGLVDLSLTPGDVGGRGRPHPDMILAAADRLAGGDPRAVAVLGDTASDIRSGLAAGASIVAGVLTGAHDRATLTAAGATWVLDHVAEFPGLLREHARPLHP
jgi:phosphonatase-like hydrolase